MNTTALTKTNGKDLAKKIDEIAQATLEIFNGSDMDFERELAVASAMGDMRALLTPEMMKPVMALMNSPLGFMTDRNPATSDRQVTPYAVEVVRDCVIEAKLRGYHVVGNEFNIIAGRFYGAKNGVVRKVLTHPGVADVKDTYEVPRLVGDKGAIVKCKITWVRDGKPDGLERDFPVKVNSFMGSDAILGKATRKLFAAALSRLTGKAVPEGEAGDEPSVATPAPEKPVFHTKPATETQTPSAMSDEEKAAAVAREQAEMNMGGK